MHVYDLDIFVTVQILEDTPGVLSLGKLCEEHGYSHEWTNGQKPQSTQNGKIIPCSTENFVPILVQGLATGSSSSSASSASTSLPQVTCENTSSSPAAEQSDETSVPAS